MAYKDVTNGYVLDGQSNLPWAQTFRMTVRVPAIANRVFDTKEHALAFVQDATTTASAIQGLMLTVFADETKGNNGLWYVKSVGEGGQLVQVFDADNGKATVEGDDFVTSTELNSAISELNTAISANTTSIGQLSGAVTTLSGNVVNDITTLSGNVVTEFGNVNTNITNLGTALTEHISTFDSFTGRTNTSIGTINSTLSGHGTSISAAEGRIGTLETNLGSLQTTVENNYTALNNKITANTTAIEANAENISALQGKFDSIGTLLKLGGTVANLATFEQWLAKNNEKLVSGSTEMGDVPVFEVGHVFIDLATNDEYLIASKSDTAFTYEVLGPVINVDSIEESYINALFATE